MKDANLLLISCLTLCATAYGPHHPRGPHRHHHYSENTKLTADAQLLQDKEHIQEDLNEMHANANVDKMSPQELEFYYFKMHDADNNTKLDGLEILRAVQHTAHDEEDKGAEHEETDFQQIIDLIDRVLEEDDLDKDGFLSYVEYVKGRNRDERTGNQVTDKMQS